MKRGAAGTGSSLVVLVFSVLCLTIFSLISLSAANIDKTIAKAEAQTVTGYYEADLRAERILAEIIEADEIPLSSNGIEVSYVGGLVSFSCPISDNKELYVEIVIEGDSLEIAQWRMRETAEWESDGSLPVWSGD